MSLTGRSKCPKPDPVTLQPAGERITQYTVYHRLLFYLAHSPHLYYHPISKQTNLFCSLPEHMRAMLVSHSVEIKALICLHAAASNTALSCLKPKVASYRGEDPTDLFFSAETHRRVFCFTIHTHTLFGIKCKFVQRGRVCICTRTFDSLCEFYVLITMIFSYSIQFCIPSCT